MCTASFKTFLTLSYSINRPIYILFIWYFNRRKDFLNTPAQDILICRRPSVFPQSISLQPPCYSVKDILYCLYA